MKSKFVFLILCLCSATALSEGNSRRKKETDARRKRMGQSAVVELPSLGLVSPVLSRLDANMQRHPVGVLTRVCLRPSAYLNNRPAGTYTSFDSFYRKELWAKVPQDRGYAVTPSHVAQLALKAGERVIFAADGSQYQVEFIDSAGDFALLSYQDQGQPCGVLSEGLRVSMAYDVEAALLETPRLLEIEAPNLGAREWTLKRQSFESLLAVTNEFALSGRDLSGPLLMTIAQGYRGQSGGALMGFQLPGGDFADELARKSQDPNFLRRILGMILAVDSEGRRLVTLPAPTMVRKIRGYFGGYWRPEQSSIAVAGGTVYPEIAAVHLRAWIDEAGTGTLADSGTGTLADSGTGTLADSGTGTLADSGLSLWSKSRQGKVPSSGLLFRGIVWRELNGWTEFEPIDPRLRADLSKPETPISGVYETVQGQVFFVSPQPMSLSTYESPLTPALLLSRQDAERFWSPRPLRLHDQIPCSLVSGAERINQSVDLSIKAVVYCDGYQPGARSQTRILAWHADDQKPSLKVLRFDHHFGCESIESQKPCPVTTSVKLYEAKAVDHSKEWTLSINGFAQALTDLSGVLADKRVRVTELKAQGLRYATAQSVHAGIFLSGGFRVKLALDNGQSATLVGPAQHGLLQYRRELLIDPTTEK